MRSKLRNLRTNIYAWIQQFFLAVMALLYHRSALQKIIILESPNDFDGNAGALYDYLIKNSYNKTYKIVWLLRNRRPEKLPPNVYGVPFNRPGLKKAYFNYNARYIMTCNCFLQKKRKEQICIYLGHATRAMKNCRGLVDIPEYVDMVISSSQNNNILMSDIYNCDVRKFQITGMPVNDNFFMDSDELSKIIGSKKFSKIIIWMPTFRKANYGNRCDTASENLGLPLIANQQDYDNLNCLLSEKDILLLVKFHPNQDMTVLKLKNTMNIRFLSAGDIAAYSVNLYRLLAQTDALISDYSSVSFDYLLLDKPMAYELEDLDSYKLGFAVENYEEYLAGEYLYFIDDLFTFVKNVFAGVDAYSDKRRSLCRKLHKYCDGFSSRRLVNYLKL